MTHPRPALLRFEWKGEQYLMTLEFDGADPIGYMLACPICARRLLLITESLPQHPRRFVLELHESLRPSVYPAIACVDCRWTVLLNYGIALPLPTASSAPGEQA